MTESRRAVRLEYQDEVLGEIATPSGPVVLLRGLGSGLARQAGAAPGRVWAVGDRGPNVSVSTAVRRWGLETLGAHLDRDGAKVMPWPHVGPALVELQVEGDTVRTVRVLPLTDSDGNFITGLPTPGGPHAVVEPVVDLQGREIEPSPSGADTEGLAVCADGSFWIGDEYGPSLLRADPSGRVTARWAPAGSEHLFDGAPYPVLGVLPALAARRRLNRGFEALALSDDERRLHLAFQSPLAHPDKAAWRNGRQVRIWTLDTETGAVVAQHLYPLDPPERFRRDMALGDFNGSDIKVSEMTALGADRLLLLERGSATTKLYAVTLRPETELPPEHLELETRPTVEELGAAPGPSVLPLLSKTLLFDTDEHPEVHPDLEGVALISPHELLLVNDNDFGVENVRTRFWRVTLDEPLHFA